MLVPLSALDAFRRDTAASPEATGPMDARWLQIATLFQQAADIPRTVRGPLLAAACEIDPVPEGGLGMRFEPPAEATAAIAHLMKAALAMEDGARFHLAYATLDAALRLMSTKDTAPAVRGHVLAMQGRVARHLGEGDLSRERYEAAELIGREHGLVELKARAWIGYAWLAQVRGNMPDCRRWNMQVLAAEGVSADVRLNAHQGLMMVAASGGDFNTAALHAWAAFGDAHPVDEAAAITDLAQLFLVAGHPKTALRGFGAALLRRPVARVEFPALGGASLAAARVLPQQAAMALIDRFAMRVRELTLRTRLPYRQASAFAELWEAYVAVGNQAAADEARERAHRLAESFGFFELLYRVTEGTTDVAPARATFDSAREVLRAVDSFETVDEVETALAGVGV